MTDTLPPGVTAVEAGEFFGGFRGHPEEITVGHESWACTGNGPEGGVDGASIVTCTNEDGIESLLGGAGNTSIGQPRKGNAQIGIAVRVNSGATEDLEHPEVNRVAVAGGGAPTTASITDPVVISSRPVPSRFEGFDVWASNADGTLDTRAGSHPYALTLRFDLPTAIGENGELNETADEPRNIEVGLPRGLVGNPTAVPQCARTDFIAERCSVASQVGIEALHTRSGLSLKFEIYNLVPPPGLPAEFGFKYEQLLVFLDAGVRTGGDYGITTHVDNVPERETDSSVTILWGVPGDETHNRWRSGKIVPCSEEEVHTAGNLCAIAPDYHTFPKPFLTLPTSCGGPPTFTIRANTWQHPDAPPIEASIQSHDSNGIPTGVTGCAQLGFGPTISTAPDTANADTPAGLTVEVKPPVGGLEDAEGFSTADIQNTTVTLPDGLVINPGQAAGLQACQETEAESGIGTENAPSCPLASKVGTVSIKTPLLEGSVEKELQGNVYVLQSNPPNLKLLVAASADGISLKLVGDVRLNEQTGQLTTTFAGTPELPFTNFKLSFSGGPQAALDTPTHCGTYQTGADFGPWSSPFVADFFTNASFSIASGPNGAPCPSDPLPFGPSLTAGSTTDQAGGFTDFSLLLQSGDAQQRISKLQFQVPQGLSGMISKVPLCPEAQANVGTCSPASQIGHTTVASGPGPYPLVVPQPGQPPAAIYLTGPYQGAPFGLSIVVPVVVGPFVLETQVVRARIDVDSHTAQITVTTNPLPQIIDGVPTDLRTVNAVIDRENFMFNPTNCNPSSFSGTAMSAQGARTAISSHFQVGSCQSLKFAPKFSVFATGKTSKANGAGLTAKLSYPTAMQGTQANITRVKVDLPKQLPSRLTTLQKACTNAQFEADPANCPAASKIGMATVTTPLLPVPLTGPAIFVSHGGEAFPSLTMVLQGYGVTVDLVGTTFISKVGIASTTFKAVPDVPFNTFTLTLPQGKFSALAANGNLCKTKLAMPTEFLAQNGLKINQSTPIGVRGCAKALTTSQKLAVALKACKKKAKGKRASCERGARKHYGSAVKKRSKARR